MSGGKCPGGYMSRGGLSCHHAGHLSDLSGGFLSKPMLDPCLHIVPHYLDCYLVLYFPASID